MQKESLNTPFSKETDRKEPEASSKERERHMNE